MPVVLIFGVATTVDSIHRSLPHRVTSLLSMAKFQAPSSSEYLSMVLHQVSNPVVNMNMKLTFFCIVHNFTGTLGKIKSCIQWELELILGTSSGLIIIIITTTINVSVMTA